jgi:hypothetical protein
MGGGKCYRREKTTAAAEEPVGEDREAEEDRTRRRRSAAPPSDAKGGNPLEKAEAHDLSAPAVVRRRQARRRAPSSFARGSCRPSAAEEADPPVVAADLETGRSDAQA